MSFVVSSVGNCDEYSKQANEYLALESVEVTPAEKFINDLPLPRDLRIRPFYGITESCRFLDAVIDFQVRPDDVFVCSTPKSGTSWVHLIVWLLKHNLDYQTAQTVDRDRLLATFNSSHGLESRVDELMVDKSLDKDSARKTAWNEFFDAYESPRVMKTFLPVHFLPKNVWKHQNKIVYVVRNPKDMIVSEYHHLNFFRFNLNIDDILNGITNDRWLCAPISDHILNFWKIRHWSNILFIAYEDLVNEPFASIKQISEFLGCAYSDDQLKELTEFVSFKNMKNVETVNREIWLKQLEKDWGKKRPDPEFRFMRKGKVGAYRDELNESQIEKIDDWIKQMEAKSDFRFKIK